MRIVIGTANRDPEEFENPDEFSVDRANSRLLPFAYGPHC